MQRCLHMSQSATQLWTSMQGMTGLPIGQPPPPPPPVCACLKLSRTALAAMHKVLHAAGVWQVGARSSFTVSGEKQIACRDLTGLSVSAPLDIQQSSSTFGMCINICSTCARSRSSASASCHASSEARSRLAPSCASTCITQMIPMHQSVDVLDVWL